jgi:hypothetical protein
MTSINHIEMAILDVRERTTRERQFAADSLSISLGMVDAQIDIHRKQIEMLNDMRRQLEEAYGERDRMLMSIIGNGQPAPDTVEHKPAKSAPKIKDYTSAEQEKQ